MVTFKLLGTVEPTWFQITFDLTPQVGYTIDEASIELSSSISIEKSAVVATCQTNRFDEEVLAWVLPYVFDWVSAEIDLFSFSTGRALTVNIDRVEWPDGSTRFLAGTAPDLATLATACTVTNHGESVRVELRDALRISIAEPTLMLALRDLGASLRYGNSSIVNCARAVEALRKALWGKDDTAEQTQAWQHFRDTLHLSKEYLKLITDASRGPRHGSSSYISASLRQEVFRRTWVIMNRLLIFRLSGNQPLDEVDYPAL